MLGLRRILESGCPAIRRGRCRPTSCPHAGTRRPVCRATYPFLFSWTPPRRVKVNDPANRRKQPINDDSKPRGTPPPVLLIFAMLWQACTKPRRITSDPPPVALVFWPPNLAPEWIWAGAWCKFVPPPPALWARSAGGRSRTLLNMDPAGSNPGPDPRGRIQLGGRTHVGLVFREPVFPG